MNIPLFVLDYILLLPVSLIRLIIIYFYGGKYNIPGFKILDQLAHCKDAKFNHYNNIYTTNISINSEILHLMGESETCEYDKNNIETIGKTTINLPLFVYDYIILLAITLVRLLLIYINGSRYQIPKLEILDIMTHSANPQFNYHKKNKIIETSICSKDQTYTTAKKDSICSKYHSSTTCSNYHTSSTKCTIHNNFTEIDIESSESCESILSDSDIESEDYCDYNNGSINI